jgi:DNA-binding response OmpR family regulator
METTIESPLHVLVIEDERTIIEFLRVGLTYEHCNVAVAEDGPSGVALTHQQEFDLIILDVMLPGIDGFRLCRQLREEGNSVPIIMLTARKDVSDRVTGLNQGCRRLHHQAVQLRRVACAHQCRSTAARQIH